MYKPSLQDNFHTEHLLVVEAALYELRDVVSEGPALGHYGDVEALQLGLGEDDVILLEAEAGLSPGPATSVLLVTVVGVRLYVVHCRCDNLSGKYIKLSG